MENERGVSGMTPGGGQRAAAGTSRSPFRVGEDRPPPGSPVRVGPTFAPGELQRGGETPGGRTWASAPGLPPVGLPPVAPVPSSVKWRSPLPGAPATGLGEGREGLVAWGLLSLEPEARRPGPCHPHVCVRCSTSRRWCGW